MPHASHPWGEPVWSFPVPVTPQPLPDDWRVDVAVVGAGFTGLATAHYVLQRSPTLRVAVFEARQVGAGASGRTGGLVLEDTAVGPLPGVEECVATLHELVSTQHIACDLHVGGCWEIGRHGALPSSPIQWADHGTLQVVNVIPGGAFDPRKFLAGLAAIIQQAGGQIFEHAPVTGLDLASRQGVRLEVGGKARLRRAGGVCHECLLSAVAWPSGLGGGRAHHCPGHGAAGRCRPGRHRLGHTYAFLHAGPAVFVGPCDGRWSCGHRRRDSSGTAMWRMPAWIAPKPGTCSTVWSAASPVCIPPCTRYTSPIAGWGRCA